MKENQNVEFKESWRDEYLKWICGFANAQGGKMYIGIADDGKVCGVTDAKRLMEDIPNKVKDILGIVVDLNLHKEGELDYLEIEVVNYPYPISYKGHYYSRSGATNLELKGVALDRYMLKALGRTWDGVPIPHLSSDDLDTSTFEQFRKFAKRSGRMSDADLQDDNAGLLDKLRMYEGSSLKRAAALVFHIDPDKFVTGAFVKFVYFR